METVLIGGNTCIILLDVITQWKIAFLYGEILIEVAFDIYWYVVICVNTCQKNGISEAEENLGYVMLTRQIFVASKLLLCFER